MLDNLDPRERRSEADTPKSRESSVARPLSDREVPLAGDPGTATLNAWLDGEVPESEARTRATARDVEFWLRIEKEVEVRREAKTPVHVYRQIMEALPEDAPPALPWFKRQVTVTPMVAMAATAGAVAVGMAIGAALTKGR
jgi:hypothetical protein